MADAHDRSHVVFRLANEEYGLAVSKVSSIIRFEPSTPVPKAPAAVMGVINLRGRVIPVVDLARRFKGHSFEPTPQSRIIVAEGSGGPVGLAVDQAHEVAEFDLEDVRPVPEGCLGPETMRAFTGVVGRNDSLIILLDLDEAVPWAEYGPATVGASAGSEGVTDV